MKVSVVVPVRNNQEMIGACIESLLDQDYPKEGYEIIIVDNNSTDSTANIIKKHPVKYVFEERIRRSQARNTGIKNSSGEIIAFTDSDCIADKSWLKEIVKGFEDESVACVAGEIRGYTPTTTAVEQFLTTINVLSHRRKFNERGEPQKKKFPIIVVTANAAYNKNILKEFGFFDTNLPCGTDSDLSWRVQWAGYKITFAPKAIIHHRYRKTITGMFRQFFINGYSRTCFLKKHRKRLDKRTFIAEYKYIALLKNMTLIIPSLIKGRNKEEKLRPIFQLTINIARISGNIYGSIKNRIIVL